MGIDTAAAQLILIAKNYLETETSNSIILGHQKNYIGPIIRRGVIKRFGASKSDLNQLYADGFLRAIGLHNIDVLDISDYEGANVIQDLNEKLTGITKKYSLVIDIGTLEHVFNIRQGFENLKELCDVNGLVVMLNPANNWLGHGFYQFSPELLFRAFDSSEGWDVKAIFVIKKRFRHVKWYKVDDPKLNGRRGNIFSKSPTYVGVIAQKLLAANHPASLQQSDYVSAWNSSEVSRLGALYLRLPKLMRGILDETLIALLTRYRGRLKRVRLKWSLDGIATYKN